MNQTTTTAPAVYKTDLPELISRGKVRDLYRAGGRLMIVATDRISAFDVVMTQPVPEKGALLTQMSRFWLAQLPACTPHHLEYVVDEEHVPEGYELYVEQLARRAMVVKRVDILPIECIVRGYLAGNGFREYQQTGAISGLKLPAGLKKSEKLPEPIFTPTTKAAAGHDQPLTFDDAIAVVAQELSRRRSVSADAGALLEQIRSRALAIYRAAAEYAWERGIIVADTKMEFGLFNGELLLADEVLTPDSSRFWPRDRWVPGKDSPSFDKQVLRDYLETLAWDKQAQAPDLPAAIIARTRQGYVDAYERLTGARWSAGR